MIVQRIRFLDSTNRKLSAVAKSLGLRWNPTGKLLDMCADLISESARSMTPKQRGYGRLTAREVRAIRSSKEKRLAVAVAHGISEAMVCSIRARRTYSWVR